MLDNYFLGGFLMGLGLKLIHHQYQKDKAIQSWYGAWETVSDGTRETDT